MLANLACFCGGAILGITIGACGLYVWVMTSVVAEMADFKTRMIKRIADLEDQVYETESEPKKRRCL